MEAEKQYRVVVIGSTGSGKSTLCNVIAGMDPNKGSFPVSAKLNACTFKTTCHQVQWLGREQDLTLTLIDTPGLDDPEGRDTEHIAEMVDKLKEIRHINLFLIVFNGQRPRMDSSLKAMFKIFQGVFGDGFWKNTVIEFSRWPFDARSVSLRENEGTTCESHEDRVNKFFMKELGVKNRIPCVFVDSCYEDDDKMECEAFARETEKMLQLIKMLPEYECKDFEKVMTENDELRKKIEELEKDRKEAEKIAKISKKEKQIAERKTLEAEKRIETSELEHARITQELTEVERKAKLKLEKCDQEMENCRREAKRRNENAEKAIAEAEEKRRESERLHQEEMLKKKLEYKSLMERRAMEEQLQRQRAEMNEKLRQAEARAEKAKHEAQLAQIRKEQAERERNRATEEVGNTPCPFCGSTTCMNALLNKLLKHNLL